MLKRRTGFIYLLYSELRGKYYTDSHSLYKAVSDDSVDRRMLHRRVLERQVRTLKWGTFELERKAFVISGRAKRVLVYTASLLIAPMPVMPYAKGTREFAIAIAACGALLSLASFYVVRGEMRIKSRPLVGTKLLAASIITLVFGMSMLLGSILYLILT